MTDTTIITAATTTTISAPFDAELKNAANSIRIEILSDFNENRIEREEFYGKMHRLEKVVLIFEKIRQRVRDADFATTNRDFSIVLHSRARSIQYNEMLYKLCGNLPATDAFHHSHMSDNSKVVLQWHDKTMIEFHYMTPGDDIRGIYAIAGIFIESCYPDCGCDKINAQQQMLEEIIKQLKTPQPFFCKF